MRTQSLVSRGAALLSVALLAGCGSQTNAGDQGSGEDVAQSSTRSSSPSPGLTKAPDKPVDRVIVPPKKPRPVTPGDFAPSVVWKKDMLIVTAFGSSTCRPVADEAAAADQDTVVVSFVERPAGIACTDDYGPTTSRIAAPLGIDLSGDVFATFELEGAPRQLIPVELLNPMS